MAGCHGRQEQLGLGMSIVIVLQQARNRRAPLSSTLRVEVAGWWWTSLSSSLKVVVVHRCDNAGGERCELDGAVGEC